MSDAIVIGLGAMGSAACYQLAKRGARVTGIDRYSPPHSFGSTHGDTRVTRLAIGEGEHFVPFAIRSHQIWRELESETGADLLNSVGGLIMASSAEHPLHGNTDFLRTTIGAAEKFGIDHRVLTAPDIEKEFPQFNLAGNEIGYYENEAGFVRPEACVATQLELAERIGAQLHRDERVIDVETSSAGVRVITDRSVYAGDKAIITAGPWIKELVKGRAEQFKIYRQVLHWFDVSDAHEQYLPGRFPVFIWSFGRWADDYVYGFPAIDGRYGGVKVATEHYDGTTTPDAVDRDVSGSESAGVFQRYVSGRLRGLAAKRIKAVVCLYTVTPNSNFVIDWLDENILVASPCSGHGFKHSAAIGEAVAELATTGRSTIDLSHFPLVR